MLVVVKKLKTYIFFCGIEKNKFNELYMHITFFIPFSYHCHEKKYTRFASILNVM